MIRLGLRLVFWPVVVWKWLDEPFPEDEPGWPSIL